MLSASGWRLWQHEGSRGRRAGAVCCCRQQQQLWLCLGPAVAAAACALPWQRRCRRQWRQQWATAGVKSAEAWQQPQQRSALLACMCVAGACTACMCRPFVIMQACQCEACTSCLQAACRCCCTDHRWICMMLPSPPNAWIKMWWGSGSAACLPLSPGDVNLAHLCTLS